MLICTAGEGWYQEEGKEAVSLEPGMVITIPAGVKHWHGAKADSWFSHISVEVPGEETRNGVPYDDLKKISEIDGGPGSGNFGHGEGIADVIK